MYTAFEVQKENGMVIRGRHYIAEKETDRMILCHGFTASMEETEKYSERLVSMGISTWIFDFCGGGFHTISDGDFHTYMTPLTEVEDLTEVVEYVLRKENRKSVCIGGCSQGGFVSAVYAAEFPEKVKKLVLLYPALCIPDDARRGSMQVITFDPQHIPDVVGTMPMQVSGKYPRSVIDMNVYELIVKYTGPVLLLHGDKDAIVPVKYADKAAEVYAQCIYHVLNGAPHGFYEEPYMSEALNYIHIFLKQIAEM